MGSILDLVRPGLMNGAIAPKIFDIRTDKAASELKHEIIAGLNVEVGQEKTLPTLLLYDGQGLKLFETITYLDEYYLTVEEIHVLEKHADSIAARIPNSALMIELGSGNLRKIKILLDALERAKKDVSYYALDLMESELIRTLSDVPAYQHVKCFGLLGTYDDGLRFLKRSETTTKPRIVLSMGSSIGNFTRDEAAGFVSQFATFLGPNDGFIIGIDGCLDPNKVYHAYNDREGVTAKFILNGLKHANKLLGYEAFEVADWAYIGEYDQKHDRHRAYVIPKCDVEVEGISIKRGERVRIEESYKFSHDETLELWRACGVVEKDRWSNSQSTYALHMVTRSSMMLATKPDEYAAYPVPSLNEWHDLWATWDKVSRQMVPDEALLSKPINLRHACIFYLGHIPTFCDIKITEATKGKPTEPTYFCHIFERGIDPDVENPEKCHAHSEVPDTWPELDEILSFQKSVRDRIRDIYQSGEAYNDVWTGRAIWLGFEHETMHLETFLYMLLQSDWVRPPVGIERPDFEKLSVQARQAAVENQWFDVPEQTITLGMHDPDSAEGPVRYYGWDVEKPPYTVTVHSFKAKGRPITNEEYARYMLTTGVKKIPASWTIIRGGNGVVEGENNVNDDFLNFIHDKAARTVYGPVPLQSALHWPVFASYDELNGCAQYMGGRIPTLEEARSIYFHADAMKKREALNALGTTIPAVNGHLVNDGVEETPPSHAFPNSFTSAAAGPDPNELFVSLDGANVGFKHWHPMPVTQNGNKLAGQAEMGGLWEWTSSALKKQQGFEPMKLYPAYSDDFYDDKHNVVLGGSWATHPRLAGRKTFVNWYQRNYPYVWAGARLVKDA